MEVRWTPEAYRDLRTIHEYIEAANPEAAVEVVARLRTSIMALEEHPQMGRVGRIPGSRELAVSPYVVAYVLTRNAIEILAIIHGAKRWPESF